MANKPLYTGEFCAFWPSDRLALGILVRQLAKPNCRMAEIGSWLGNGSTQVFLEELRAHPGSSLLCVDTWKGSPNVARHQDVVANYDVFGTFLMNAEKVRGSTELKTIAASSTEAAAQVEDASLDLIFIDADHSYKCVREDIAAWRPKVRPGGLLCGHDCEARVTPENRQRLLDNRDADTIPGTGKIFVNIHPGSILAVHEAFDGAAHLWAEAPMPMPDGTLSVSTIWFVWL